MKEHFRAANKKRESAEELASLARLITFARQSAQSIEAEFPVYCLELALGAVLQEIQELNLKSLSNPRALIMGNGKTPNTKVH